MFNFLFDGKIGDILAPVVPANQLFLAIQHFKNAELNALLNSIGYNPASLADGGYAAIHVACRYNNRVALDILLSRGTSIQLADQNGDTPLHYAAKYGHLDLAKNLVERGAAAHSRNKNNQTPYDIAESHLMRQYLLPLQLSAERGMPEFQQAPPYTNLGGISFPPPATLSGITPAPVYSPPVQYNIHQTPSQIGIPSAVAPSAGPSTFGGIQPSPPATLPVPSPPTAANSTAPPFSSISAVPPSYAYPGVPHNSRPSNSRMIQPDGFHSSASDPVLQQKYGHIIEKPSIAPPPTGPIQFAPPSMPAPPVGTQVSSGSSGIYSRYVPYDAHNNTAAPIPQPSAYNYPSMAPIAPSLPPSVMLPPQPATSSSPTKQITSINQSSSNVSASKFLGHKAPVGELFGGGIEPLIMTPAKSSPSSTQVLSPFNEGDIITASATSNSVL